jgi:hypothetical protein
MALFRAVDRSLLSGEVLIDGIDTKTIPFSELADDAMRYASVGTIVFQHLDDSRSLVRQSLLSGMPRCLII